MSERRFNEAEVAAIFSQASEAQALTPDRQLPSGRGLTVGELREIGREVGISSDLITNAANMLERVGVATSRRFLGFPIGVRQTVELDRKLTSEEWDRFVVDLRETFDARGTVKNDGSLRQWTNGNLQALLEPTENGHRIRLRTTKGDARGIMTGGLAFLTAGLAGLVAAGFQGALDVGMLSALSLTATVGAGMFGAGAIGLPRWARLRQQQMRDIAARLASSSRSQPLLDSPRDQHQDPVAR